MLDRPEPSKPKVCARRLKTFLLHPLAGFPVRSKGPFPRPVPAIPSQRVARSGGQGWPQATAGGGAEGASPERHCPPRARPDTDPVGAAGQPAISGLRFFTRSALASVCSIACRRRWVASSMVRRWSSWQHEAGLAAPALWRARARRASLAALVRIGEVRPAAPLCPACSSRLCRWPSWVCACMPGTILSVRRARGTRLLSVSPGAVLTTAFPITPPYSRSTALMLCRATLDDRRPANGGVKRLPGGFGIR